MVYFLLLCIIIIRDCTSVHIALLTVLLVQIFFYVLSLCVLCDLPFFYLIFSNLYFKIFSHNATNFCIDRKTIRLSLFKDNHFLFQTDVIQSTYEVIVLVYSHLWPESFANYKNYLALVANSQLPKKNDICFGTA